VGAIYSLTLNNEYSSVVKLLPEASQASNNSPMGNLGGLAGLAGLAGINIGDSNSNVDIINPSLYPNLVESSPFLLELIKSNIYNPNLKKWQTILDYLNEKNENAPLSFSKIFSKEERISKIKTVSSAKSKIGFEPDLLTLNDKEKLAISFLKTAIKIETDKKSSAIMIKANMLNPIVAANMTSIVQAQLTKYVISYRTEKANKEMRFLQDRQAEARKRYDQSLFTLSNYKDQNRNPFLNVAKDQEKKLQYEVDLSFNLYSTLTTQLNETKIRIQRETPLFKVLEPAQVNYGKSSPNRLLITVGAILFGLFLALIYVFFKSVNLKELLS
jgi:capsular polysaccharide biosynthesis protein